MHFEAATALFAGISALSDSVNLWRSRDSQSQQQQQQQQQTQQQQRQQQQQQIQQQQQQLRQYLWEGLAPYQRKEVDVLETSLAVERRKSAELEAKLTQARVTILLVQVIDQEVLEVMLANISAARKRLVSALADVANSDSTKNNEVAIASSVICGELRRMKMLNNNELPAPELESFWTSHRCHGA